MNSFKTSKLIRWWLTPKFPKKHIEIVLSYKPQGLWKSVRNYYRTWIVHPVKRRVVKIYCLVLQKFFGMKVVGITGSTGKTTTKEMLASILGLVGETVYSFANIDPIYNIPTTIFRCKLSTKYLILEMGVEYLNEMDFYLWMVKPDVGIVINIYPTHILSFNNEEGVFKEKSKLVKGLSKEKYAVLNGDNKFLQKLDKKIKAKIVWFGGNSETKATDIKYTRDFKTGFTLHLGREIVNVVMPIIGKQFVGDALAAAGGARVLGVGIEKIKNGLETFEVQEHRMKIKKLRSGAILIDDSYNNNPEAAKEAIRTLKEMAGIRKTMLIFGDMLELGKDEVKYHNGIGKIIKRYSIDHVIGVGILSKYVVSNKKFWVKDWKDAFKLAKSIIHKNTIVLIKGSRSIQLEKVVDLLK